MIDDQQNLLWREKSKTRSHHITIGQGSSIASTAVLNGVTMRENSVIATAVSNDIPTYSIVGGVPANVIRMRK